jgi:ribonuclease VapC
MSRWVIDSYALLVYYQNEEGAERVEQLLADEAQDHWMSLVNLGEVYYKLLRANPQLTASDFWNEAAMLPIQFAGVDRVLALAAGRIKARYPMAYADCFAAALAQQLNARVVTGDREFVHVEREGIVAVEWLARPRRR